MTKMASYPCIEFDLNSDPDPVLMVHSAQGSKVVMGYFMQLF